MFKLKHNEPRVAAATQAEDRGERQVRRVRGWLRRWLGRECASGLWTLSPDGKLICESLRAKAEPSD